MKRSFPVWLLAFGHGLNDFIAGYLLAHLLHLKATLIMVSACFLTYNVLAFGGQYVAALWLQNGLQRKQAFLLTSVLNGAAVFSFFLSPPAALIMAGCASALYHVTGGAMAAEKGKAAAVGLFAAPGIIGLTLGGYLAATGIDVWMYIKIAALLFLLPGFLFSLNHSSATKQSAASPVHFDRHDYLMLLLLTIITLRSAIWNIVQLIHQHNLTWLLWIGISAFAGKIIGGWLADRIGWRLYNVLSLSAAAPLVHFFRHDLLLFCLGVALLQSGIPANTVLVLQAMQNREKGIAFSFGTAVLLAGIIGFAFWKMNDALPVMGLCCLAIVLILEKKRWVKWIRVLLPLPFPSRNTNTNIPLP